MSDVSVFQILKERIFEDDRVEEILNLLECDNIHYEQGGELITAQLPPDFLSKNKRAVQIKNNSSLNSYIRNRGFNGDIFGLVSFIKNRLTSEEDIRGDLFYAKQWIMDELGYDDIEIEAKPKCNVNNWLKDIQKKRKKRKKLEAQKPNRVINEEILNYYKFLPYYPWLKEGILSKTQTEWETGFDIITHRVITPIRNSNGELIGVKGRAILPTADPDQKYIYLHKCNKSIEIFGLNKTLPYILERKEIILFEGYKSVMKAWQMGYKNVGSIEGDDISDYQVALIKTFGIDIKIVLAYDKDKFFKEIKDEETGEIKNRIFSMEYIESQAKKFTNRKVFSIMDKGNELQDKMSPVDKGTEVWNRIYNNKVQISI